MEGYGEEWYVEDWQGSLGEGWRVMARIGRDWQSRTGMAGLG